MIKFLTNKQTKQHFPVGKKAGIHSSSASPSLKSGKIKKQTPSSKRRSSEITEAEWFRIDQAYNDEFPEYLQIINRNKIKMRASVWEGAPAKWITITPKDVINYYYKDARNISSGIRTLSTFSTDWRMVDNMAKEALEVFKIINREALEEEGHKYGMELKN